MLRARCVSEGIRSVYPGCVVGVYTPEEIQYIKNPSEEVKMAAVKQDGWAIQYIKNPSEAMQMTAVQQNSWAIQYIKNPSEEVKMAAERNK